MFLDELREDAVRFESSAFDVNLLMSLAEQLVKGAKLHGDVVLLGVFDDRTPAWITHCLDVLQSDKRVLVFDAFSEIEYFVGTCKGTTADQDQITCDHEAGIARVANMCDEYAVVEPEIYPGWFADTLGENLPSEIAFVHVDCGFYDEIFEGLLETYPRLVPGAPVVINRYGSGYLRCVQEATDEFLFDKPETISQLAHTSRGQHFAFSKMVADAEELESEGAASEEAE